MLFEKPVVVIDNGSRYMKVGFSCDNHPVAIFSTAVGRPKYLEGKIGKHYYDVFVGEEAMERSETLDITSPLENGKIVNWDNMERVWHHTLYRELKVAPEDRAVLIALTSSTSIQEKFKCCQVLFETLNVPALCVQPQSVLALYGSGVTTGLTVDFGYKSVDITPIYEGRSIPHAFIQTSMAASHMLESIKSHLTDYEKTHNINHVAECILRNNSFVYLSPPEPRNIDKILNNERSYKLPSGEEITVTERAFTTAESLFKQVSPISGEIIKDEDLPLHEAVATSALKCDNELRNELYEAIIICGGLSVLPGLSERLAKEMESFIYRPVNVIPGLEPYVLTWLGGAILAGMTNTKKIWLTKSQFEEHGMKYVRKKFL